MAEGMLNPPNDPMSGFIDLDSILDVKAIEIKAPADLYSKTARKIINFINLVTGMNYLTWEQIQSKVFHYYNETTGQRVRVVLKHHKYNDYYVAEARTGQMLNQEQPTTGFVNLDALPIIEPPSDV